MFSFSLPFSGQVAISFMVYALLNLFAGLIDSFAPQKGSKIANYIFRFAVGGFVGTLIGIHLITNASGKRSMIMIDIISGLWGAVMFLWIFNVNEKERGKLLAIFSAIVFSQSNSYSLFWGFGKMTVLTATLTIVLILVALYLNKIISTKGQFATGLLNGMFAIASGSAFYLRSDIKGLLIAFLIAITSLTFHKNVLKSQEAKEILATIIDKKNIEKVKESVKKAEIKIFEENS